ncbi:C40 family peptidase [Streptomyces sp. A1136]|uniref:C40 family peptidase n=1 Tax=Streptomyces sp. A1136 TaxID=2563102 RepID=UPI00109E4B8B|nr:C40 family peptidase [Streptomyces sp. A1136]THA52460.1 glycoside hydrolase [Streptomyces sp. A1136]
MTNRPRLVRTVCVAAAVLLTAAGPPATARAEPLPATEPAAAPRPATAPRPAAAPRPGTEPAGAPATGESVGALLTRLQDLYQKAEQASEAYNATEVALKARQDEERRLGTELGKARSALSTERARAGRLAREQYQGSRGFLSPYLRMLLSGDLRHASDQRRLTALQGARTAGVLSRLERGEQRAGTLAGAARKALDTQRDLTAERKRHKEEVTGRLKEVERLLASLTPGQLARLDARETAVTAEAQRELIGSGRLGRAGSPAASLPASTPTAAGGAALAYAVAQIGKPYVWGAEGPASFDCSGLTSRAWEHAGRPIPRTSQEQWAQLPKVPLDRLRPGDLVVYFPTATHVALYIGDGKVIQAPRPGATVKVSPIAANPVLGAVRPDPAGTPLASFTLPPLPESAAAGDDTGYSGSGPDGDTEAETSAR